MPTKTSAPAYALEAIDLYGNWKVTKLKFELPKKAFGLVMRKSKFKIKNKGSKHVLIKKENLGWNGNKNEIILTEVKPSEGRLFNNNLRLKAVITFEGDTYEVSFGSNDGGKALQIQVLGKQPQTQPGGFGSAARGGG